LLPLVISYGQQQLPQLGQSTAGILIALYQVGYGLAAFGGGALQQSLRLPMQSIFAWGAVLALAQALISLPISIKARAQRHG
jgi:predicted MFS family arabinose efflux permease